VSENITSKSAIELNRSFTSGELTAEEITKAFLERATRLNKDLNAFISLCPELALQKAKLLDQRLARGDDPKSLGKLAGVPIGVKDLINMIGTETTAGSNILKGHKSVYNATIVNKVINAGAIPLGKLNLDEFAMGSSNETSAFGPCKNPWDLSRVPGGSSGGSSAAVSAELVPLAFGTDTGGSIRQPAAYCGITGMKPTYGKVSRYGIIAFASSLDQAGPMTKDVKDNALLLEVMSGYDAKDSTSINIPTENYLDYIKDNFEKTGSLKGLKIGISDDLSADNLDPEMRSALDNTIKTYQDLGAEIVKVKLPNIKASLACYYIIAPAEASSNLSRYDGVRFGHRAETLDLESLYKESRTQFGKEVQRRIMLGTYVLSSGYYDAYYKKAQEVRRLIFNDFSKAFEECDVILSLTTPSTAFKFGAKSDPLEMYLSDVLTVPVNLAGLPSMSLNGGYDKEGMPIGIQLVGKALGEKVLYNTAFALEQSLIKELKKPSLTSFA
jgi:aspartyl-tRNA(Asn)/glutamyl-tRNA(Gln) amidotransferase subunit A